MVAKRKRQTLDEILREAMEDFAENGFRTKKQLDGWMRRLEEAVKRSMRTEAEMERILAKSLRTIFGRFMKNGAYRVKPGVQRFTVERLKPAMRTDLNRRILASAQLIKLNRETAIAQTLRRFSGWATSIQKGGTEAVDFTKAKRDIKKGITKLPFEERRVLIDQGYKFSASLREVIAMDGNAIAAEWVSHWRQAGYDYREDHKERDDKIYLIRGSWAEEKGLIKPGKVGYTDEITKPGEEVFCRCSYRYIYNLRDLPPDMLTEKGKAEMERVKKALAA